MVGMVSCIHTYKGMEFDPTNPEEEKILTEDIAHALSLMCRANGHFKSFYSVAQHSVNCAEEAAARGYSKRVQLACLLHDASEAYLSDITRPVKEKFTQYHAFEEKLQNMIYSKWICGGLSDEERACVKSVDDAILYSEFLHFVNMEVFEEKPDVFSVPQFDFGGFEETEQKFLNAFLYLK